MRVSPINFSIKSYKNGVNFSSKNKNFGEKGESKIDQTALRTNVYVLNSIKKPIAPTFSKATKEDYEILTAKDYEAPLRRVKWFNPKDNKAYWLIKNGRTEENNGWNIRILDENGAFIKNAKIGDENIVIADVFSCREKKILPSPLN